MKLFIKTPLQKDEGLWGRSCKDREGHRALHKGSCPLESCERQSLLAVSIQTFSQGCNTAGMGKKSREKSNRNNLYLQRAWSNSMKAPQSRLQLGIDPKPCCHRKSALGASWEGDGSTGTVVLGAVLGQAAASCASWVARDTAVVWLCHSRAMGRWHHLERNPPTVLRTQ